MTKDTRGKKILRGADSLGANIAEGHGRYSCQDNQRFVKIARGSLNETRHWLRLAYPRNLLTQEQIDRLHPLLKKLSPKLNAYLNSLKQKAHSQQSTVNSQQSTVNSQQPTANSQQPTVNSQQSTANSQQPTVNNQPND